MIHIKDRLTMTETEQDQTETSQNAPRETSAPLPEEEQENTNKAKVKAKKKSASAPTKLKLSIQVPTGHVLQEFHEGARERGVKGIDIGSVVLEALEAVPSQWWTDKLEGLTPIEYKIHLALNNPELRKELNLFLEEKLPGTDEPEESIH